MTRSRAKRAQSSLALLIEAVLDLKDRLRWVERTDIMAQNRLILGEAKRAVYNKLRKLVRKRPTRVTWWARGAGIDRAGPYATQAEAAKSLRLVPGKGSKRATYPPDAFVWPEEE